MDMWLYFLLLSHLNTEVYGFLNQSNLKVFLIKIIEIVLEAVFSQDSTQKIILLEQKLEVFPEKEYITDDIYI